MPPPHIIPLDPTVNRPCLKEGGFYPINFLRNIGLKFSDTPYVFLSEIDFIPSDGIEDNLNLHVNNLLKTGGNKVSHINDDASRI